ncbi:hypothetical protein [Bremerella alba]|uniref:Uncharacterized protein n=1 Tax=Bremerella alba TaxID=980252 RepID=A0A7V8V251_9BACT|nr:hypothetical protein [Bremerella alba]MBA2113524.1 hypothetical protein [Bremerella alba]
MSAYLILLGLITSAWAIVGFSVAMLLLKLRWNLIGGVLLAFIGFILPMCVGVNALDQSGNHSGMRLRDATTIFGMLEFSYEVLLLVSVAGMITGVLAGTIVGLCPRTNDEGARQRNARSWTTWKLIVAGPLAMTVVSTLFFLADIRAKDRLAQFRDKHETFLDVQEEVAPRQQNGAAIVHDALLLALLEDESPDWILHDYRQMKNQPQPVLATIRRNDFDLLKIFLPSFPHTQQVLDYAKRHEASFLNLRSKVLEEGLEYRHWDEEVARFTAVHALAQLQQGDVDSALNDLKLLRVMAAQTLDRRIEDSFSFVQIEEFRYLVFQGMLGKTTPVPDQAYDEMLTDVGDIDASLRRSLKRNTSQEIVRSIDNLLHEHPDERLDFAAIYQRVTERIIYQEHIPDCTHRLENEINQTFQSTTDPFVVTPGVAFPMLWNMNEAWLLTSQLSSHAYQAIQYRFKHHTRLELVKAVRMLQRERSQKNRFLTQQEFVIGATSSQLTSAIPLEYLTLHNPTTGKAEGAIVASPLHAQLDDYLGLYFGPAIFPIVDAKSPSMKIRDTQFNGTWELASVKSAPMRLMIPTPKASTSNPSPPMR